MGLKLALNKDLKELTDMMINVVKEKGISFENMNILLVKVPLEDSSTILTSESMKKLEGYKSGVGRVIALPRLIDDNCANPAIGDYVVYSHDARYTVAEPVTNFIFDLNLNSEADKEPIILIRDCDIMAILKQDLVHSKFI